MKCPYCAEEIQDDANVCRYCGRDLALILSLKQENKQLREKISALSALEDKNRELTDFTDSTLTESETSSVSPPPSPSHSNRGILSLRQRAWAVILPAVAVVASYILDQELFFLHATETQIAAATTEVFGLTEWHFAWSDILLLSCVASGCWVGIRQPGRHLKSYFFLGTLTALVVAVGLTSYETIRFGDIGSGFGEIGLSFSGALVLPLLFDPDYVPTHTFGPLNAYTYTIIVTALFISGGLFGDLINRISRTLSKTKGERSVASLLLYALLSLRKDTSQVIANRGPTKTLIAPPTVSVSVLSTFWLLLL